MAAANEMGIGDNSYCRDPDKEGALWCYTTDKNTRWEYCKPIKKEDWNVRLKEKSADLKYVGCHYQLGGMMHFNLDDYVKEQDLTNYKQLFKAVQDIALTYGYTHIAMSDSDGTMGNPVPQSIGKKYPGKCSK